MVTKFGNSFLQENKMGLDAPSEKWQIDYQKTKKKLRVTKFGNSFQDLSLLGSSSSNKKLQSVHFDDVDAHVYNRMVTKFSNSFLDEIKMGLDVPSEEWEMNCQKTLKNLRVTKFGNSKICQHRRNEVTHEGLPKMVTLKGLPKMVTRKSYQ